MFSRKSKRKWLNRYHWFIDGLFDDRFVPLKFTALMVLFLLASSLESWR